MLDELKSLIENQRITEQASKAARIEADKDAREKKNNEISEQVLRYLRNLSKEIPEKIKYAISKKQYFVEMDSTSLSDHIYSRYGNDRIRKMINLPNGKTIDNPLVKMVDEYKLINVDLVVRYVPSRSYHDPDMGYIDTGDYFTLTAKW